jgi:hypothetical protein
MNRPLFCYPLSRCDGVCVCGLLLLGLHQTTTPFRFTSESDFDLSFHKFFISWVRFIWIRVRRVATNCLTAETMDKRKKTYPVEKILNVG